VAAVAHIFAAFVTASTSLTSPRGDSFCGLALAQQGRRQAWSTASPTGPGRRSSATRGLGARGGLSGGGGGPRPQWLPHYGAIHARDGLGYYGLTPEQAKLGGLNPKMFNSFLDGSKPAIETSAVCNATGLTPAPDGLEFPSCSIENLPSLMKPRRREGCAITRDRWKCFVPGTRVNPYSLRHPLRRLGGVRRRERVHPALLLE